MDNDAWWSIPVDIVLSRFRTHPFKGLKSSIAEDRIKKYGPNIIKEAKKRSVFMIFIDQFKSFLVLILIVASLFSIILGEVKDALVILAIVLLMSLLGFIQEYRAEKTIEALRKLTTPKAKVIRDGVLKIINASQVVPGDLVIVEEGDRVPADIRLIESLELHVDESSFTGESIPVLKNASAIVSPKAPIYERKNMVFMGTYVIRGKGKGVVVATGMNTELGKIARAIEEVPMEKTFLQKSLDRLGKNLGYMFIASVLIVFILGYVRGLGTFLELLMTSIALAVAAIPEGLPAIVTIILALGVWRMAKRNAIVKKISQVETLGITTVICTDKTGTLTKNEMTVRKVVLPSGLVADVSGSGYSLEGKIHVNGREVDVESLPEEFKLLIEAAVLCNNAFLRIENGKVRIMGDPLEASLLILAEKAGVSTNSLRGIRVRVHEIPFDSSRKMMTTVHRVSGEFIVYCKGAPEVILSKSKYVMINGEVIKLADEVIKQIESEVKNYASQALRILAFAFKKVKELDARKLEQDLVFLGFVGIMDPPREEVYEAIAKAKEAGIKVIMVTGDHKETAIAIAKEIGLEVEGKLVLTGKELEEISDEELEKIVDNVAIFARVTPSHKVKVVKALKNRGHIVAMTGDGVNDAPALKMADIGIAMGIRGTDVAKEAADLILLDDNFSTIVKAVEEGRIIYDNVKKPIRYLISANIGEVASILLSEIANLPLIFRPAQILWMNLITDSFPAIALGLEPSEPGIMSKKPKDIIKELFTLRTMSYAIFIGLIMAVITMFLYLTNLPLNISYARAAAFTFIVFSQVMYALSSRSAENTITKLGILSNRSMVYALIVSIVLQLLAIYGLPSMFDVEPLSLSDLSLIMLISLIIILVDETRKILKVKIY
ncbi:MAG: ATPase [Thermoprotei archaeon]|nr:MAG: ATPase [Thermoprotei archaeon]